jgi:hypothetical protein
MTIRKQLMTTNSAFILNKINNMTAVLEHLYCIFLAL